MTWACAPGLEAFLNPTADPRTLVYDTGTLTEADLPDDVRGRIGWAPANASFVTGMRVRRGEDATRDWLKAMHANAPKLHPTNTPQVAAAVAGEIDVGLVQGVNTQREITPIEEISNPMVSPGELAGLEGTQALLREVGITP